MVRMINEFKREIGTPLYLQIKNHLTQKIENSFWPEESMIPTENELCKEYGVSKITIREAIKLLVKDGKLVRTAGKGTFVMRQKLEQKLNRFFSFSNWAKQNGLVPASRILRVETTDCDKHIAGHLCISEKSKVVKIERMRLGDEEPLMLETIWLPEALFPDLHLKDLSNIPLNTILAEEYETLIVKAVESIEPGLTDEYIAKLLGVEKDMPILHVEHSAFTVSEKIIYFVSSYYRGDRVKFTIELS